MVLSLVHFALGRSVYVNQAFCCISNISWPFPERLLLVHLDCDTVNLSLVKHPFQRICGSLLDKKFVF